MTKPAGSRWTVEEVAAAQVGYAVGAMFNAIAQAKLSKKGAPNVPLCARCAKGWAIYAIRQARIAGLVTL